MISIKCGLRKCLRFVKTNQVIHIVSIHITVCELYFHFFFLIGCYFLCRRSWEGNSSTVHCQPAFLILGGKGQCPSSIPGALHPHCVQKQLTRKPASETQPTTHPALQKSSTHQTEPFALRKSSAHQTQPFGKVPGCSEAASSLMTWKLMRSIYPKSSLQEKKCFYKLGRATGI